MTAALTAAPAPVEAVPTLRFGRLDVPAEMIYRFPHGLPGFADLDRFALLPVREGLAWLQAVAVPSLSFLVVAPDRVRSGAWSHLPGAWAIVTLGDSPERCTTNLRAPLVLDPEARTGVQWIAQDPVWSTAEPVDLTQL